MSDFDMSRLPFLMMSAAEVIETNARALKEAITMPSGEVADLDENDPHDMELYEREMLIASDLKQAAKEMAGISASKDLSKVSWPVARSLDHG